MHRVDAPSKPDEIPRPLEPLETPADCYRGVDLAPSTLESLVTWDVSGHAQRERDRLSSAYRRPETVQGSY
jgi:hypothetical protein